MRLTFLLISTDQETIDEFERVCAVGEVRLEVVNQLSEVDPLKISHLFIDTKCIDLVADHPFALPVTIVHNAKPAASVWKLAARLNARAIISLPGDRDYLLDLCVSRPKRVAQILQVSSVVGGCGVTTVAGGVAGQLAANGNSVVLVDNSGRNQELSLVCGIEQSVDFKRLAQRVDELTPVDLLKSLPLVDQVAVFDTTLIDAVRLDKTIEELAALVDFIVLDSGLNIAIDITPDKNFVVVPNLVSACSQTRKYLSELSIERTALIVRQMPGAGLSPIDVATHLQIPLWANISTSPTIVEHVEQGLGITSLHRTMLQKPISEIVNRLESGSETLRAA